MLVEREQGQLMESQGLQLVQQLPRGQSSSRSITWALEARRYGRDLGHGPMYRQPRGLVGCCAIRWRCSRLGWKPLGSER